MLHERMLHGQTGLTGLGDRRRSPRLPFPAELLLQWFHDMRTPVRYRVMDAGAGGFRIRTCVPLIEGMTGIAMKLLPEGTPVERTVTVAWVGPAPQDHEGDPPEHEAGLRLI